MDKFHTCIVPHQKDTGFTSSLALTGRGSKSCALEIRVMNQLCSNLDQLCIPLRPEDAIHFSRCRRSNAKAQLLSDMARKSFGSFKVNQSYRTSTSNYAGIQHKPLMEQPFAATYSFDIWDTNNYYDVGIVGFKPAKAYSTNGNTLYLEISQITGLERTGHIRNENWNWPDYGTFLIEQVALGLATLDPSIELKGVMILGRTLHSIKGFSDKLAQVAMWRNYKEFDEKAQTSTPLFFKPISQISPDYEIQNALLCLWTTNLEQTLSNI